MTSNPFHLHCPRSAICGVQAASRFYFGRDLRDLSLSEWALLAGLIRSPGRYNPFLHPQRALERRGQVLDAMVRLEMIDESSEGLCDNEPRPDLDPAHPVTCSPRDRPVESSTDPSFPGTGGSGESDCTKKGSFDLTKKGSFDLTKNGRCAPPRRSPGDPRASSAGADANRAGCIA